MSGGLGRLGAGRVNFLVSLAILMDVKCGFVLTVLCRKLCAAVIFRCLHALTGDVWPSMLEVRNVHFTAM